MYRWNGLPVDRHAEAVAQTFGRPPVYDGIFSCCTTLSLVRLSATSCEIRAAVVEHRQRAFNVDKRLRRFFADPRAFRALMARTGMLVSGSFALQLFDRTIYPSADLDCYVYADGKVVDIAAHLVREGYTYCPTEGQAPDFATDAGHFRNGWPTADTRLATDEKHYGMRHVGVVFRFKRAKTARASTDDAREVQLVVATKTPMATILSFHSTCVMNVVSHAAAYALYPRATFVERHALDLSDNMRYATVRALAKYAGRGWR
ncbi:uncharacterized protein BXZ73DRAFT_52754 [Epithele typhae]|uniref:uncharacterized protein n=1 Tax=Epithele typhae TaxID=378194 RepID=UPI0020079B07|nr:uncharacterized protein BXZ73DRAFT_52754 [Epithele typhae]KAH9918719.1 hypothetical protein BXZ73DRAFT_52754 [Epithele typhae]